MPHYMMADLDAVHLIDGLLAELKIDTGLPLMVHASFKRASQAGYRAESVAARLAERLAGAALLMPAMSWRKVTPENPFFDELETPSITGILSEIFRRDVATMRSLHPTHSVAGFGPRSADMLATHHIGATTCSDLSPFGKLIAQNGQVLLFDLGIRYCTLMHHFEEKFAPDIYLEAPETTTTYRCRRRDGVTLEVMSRRHRRIKRNFWRFGKELDARGKLNTWQNRGIACSAFKARDLSDIMAEQLRRDPRALLAEPNDPLSHY